MIAHLLPAAVIVPLLVAAVLLPLNDRLPRIVADVLATLTALFVAWLGIAAAVATVHAPIQYWFGGWKPHEGMGLGIEFVADPLGAGLCGFVGVLFALAFVFSWRYFDAAGTLFHTLMLVFLAAMAGFSLAGDLFNLFVFFELMSVAAFALASYKIEEPQSIQGALNFAVSNSIGAFLVLIGIALLYGRTGMLNMAQIAAAIAHQRPDGLLVVSCTLILCGFFVKGAVVPFHLWLDDAHAVAPTPLCVIFSGIMVQISLYAVARVYGTIYAAPFHGHDAPFVALLVGVGIVTALLGGVMAYLQDHLKRLLAFSTISHSGMFICGIAVLSPLGIQADELFVVAHGLVKAALFMGAGIVLQRTGSVDAAELRGKCRSMLPAALLFVVGGLALAGLPPFGLAAGKAALDKALHGASLEWVAAIFGVASALDGAAVLRVTGSVFFGFGSGNNDGRTPEREHREGTDRPNYTPLPMLLAAYAALLLCLAWGPFVRRPGVHEAIETLPYVLLAVAIAWLGCRIDLSVLRRTLEPLRAIHDGVFTDYVLWMIAGVAAYGAAMLPVVAR